MNKINENKIFGYGKVFPVIDNLKTLDNKAYQPNYSKNKYTLIDFWFSSCKPCLITFPKFKEIYSQYHEKGFQIEAISVDTEKYINDWRNTVAKYELPWINVLDESKKFSTKNNINAFPTSFLVNDKGEIIMKDIDPEKLEVFLRENLN
ncbi:MAG: TlpA family protein disulfide reductase [Weeksellaceae bacterium]|nr:TlpA family protein disulfide reductase [Weeksellaceae bacterium]